MLNNLRSYVLISTIFYNGFCLCVTSKSSAYKKECSNIEKKSFESKPRFLKRKTVSHGKLSRVTSLTSLGSLSRYSFPTELSSLSDVDFLKTKGILKEEMGSSKVYIVSNEKADNIVNNQDQSDEETSEETLSINLSADQLMANQLNDLSLSDKQKHTDEDEGIAKMSQETYLKKINYDETNDLSLTDTNQDEECFFIGTPPDKDKSCFFIGEPEDEC